MLLTADIGNTSCVIGLWRDDELVKTSRLSSNRERTADEWRMLISSSIYSSVDEEPRRAIFSSDVPQINTSFENALRDLGIENVLKVGIELALPFTFDYEGNEGTLGADRLANAAGGVVNYGEDLIIVDFGTAITFCLLTQKTYRGGVIAPGIQSAVNALFQETAKLPEISIRPTASVLGKSTTDSIVSGAYYGWKGLVTEIVGKLLERPEAKGASVQTIATGGIIEELDFAQEIFDVVDGNLTLRGLKAIAELSK